MSDMTPAVIYARFSSENQRQESIEGQIRECRIFAERNGFDVIAEYTDSALTGRTDQRPGFQKMVKDAEKRQFRMVIVWKLDRFARNRFDAATYRAKLKKYGVEIVSAKEFIPEGAEGIIVESLMEGMAEYYSANLAENVRRGLYESALQRKALSKLPYGFRRSEDGKYEIDPETAPVVQRIFQEYIDGKTPRDIAAELNADGLRNSVGRRFQLNNIQLILRNEKYTGMYRYGDIEDPEGIPSIIPADIFQRAQELRAARYRRRSPRVDNLYLLSGKTFCGLCGRLMTGEYAKSKTGDLHYYYFCRGAKMHECEAKRIKRDLLEDLVKEELTKILTSGEFQEEITAMILEHPDEEQEALRRNIEIQKKSLSEEARKHENMLKAIEAGIFSAGLSERLQTAEKRISDLQRELAEMQLQVLPPITREDIEFSFYELNRMRSESPLNWQKIIDILVSRVYVFPDHIVILLNHPGANNRITVDLETLKSSTESQDGQPMNTLSNLLWFGCAAISARI